MGIEFAPLSGLGIIQLARLAERWNSSYPVVEEKEALAPNLAQPGSLAFEFRSGVSPVRLWLHAEDQGFLVQVQHDRLILNWRATDGSDYPRFEALRAEFHRLWNDFSDHLVDNRIDPPIPIYTEFTYVNRIPLEGDEGPEFVIGLLKEPSVDIPGRATVTRFQFVREIDPSGTGFSGQVILTGEPQVDDDERAYVVTVATRLSLTAGISEGALEASLDQAHIISSASFAAVTTPEIHDRWGRSA